MTMHKTRKIDITYRSF